MKVKTAELTGPALDYLVGIVEGGNPVTHHGNPCLQYENGAVCDAVKPGLYGNTWHKVRDYSTDWSQGGPLIDRYIRLLEHDGEEWKALCEPYMKRGPTALVAAMRAIATEHHGEDVDIPEELLPPGHIEKPAGIEGIDICMHCHVPLTKPPTEACDQCGKDQIPF